MIERVEVVDTARSDEMETVARFMREAGFDAAPSRRRHSVQDTQHVGEGSAWIVTVVLAAPVGAFFTSIASAAGKDAYSAIRRWVLGLSRARSHGYGQVEIQDPDGTRISIREAVLPPEALDALLEIDWPALSGKALIWTDDHGWVDSEWYVEQVVRPGIEDGTFMSSNEREIGEPIEFRRRHPMPPPRDDR